MSRLFACALLLPALAAAQEQSDAGVADQKLTEEIEVQGHYLNQVGTTDAASAGSYTHQLIEDRPLLRPGEIEELVPGLIVTQHSGAGKANQFLLRGFNLDHGTDFATSLDGVPMNLPSHAHGQGYDDLNSIIPELISRVDYVKGPYSAAKGDFASAGAADLTYVNSLPQGHLEGSAGSYGYYRTFAAASPDALGGKLLIAFEGMHEDGPWVKPEDYYKYNAVLRYTRSVGPGFLSLMAQGYSGEWNATDQIPLQPVKDGLLSRFGEVDASDGGKSHRFTFSANWAQELGGGELKASAYAVKYDLDLFSNFTFFLEDQTNGDQMEQYERRWYEGFSGSWKRELSVAGLPSRIEVGWESRIDHIDPLGLFHTVQRVRIQTWSLDSVTQSSAALYGTFETHLTRWLRISLGLRAALYDFRVVSVSDERNSGEQADGLVLPKASVIFGPWARSELFFNFGQDYHSNDARGVTAHFDARDPAQSVSTVAPLPKSYGWETGLRTEIVPKAQLSVALWGLILRSEQVWDADAGSTVPSAPTHRIGVELSARYQPIKWLLFDLDASFSRARFLSYGRDDPNDGPYVPEAIESAVSAGVSVHQLGPWSASLFMRYFGPRSLTPNDLVRSSSSLLFNAQASYHLTKNVQLSADLFNILNAQPDDIAYFYTSRISPAAAARDDIHFHPAEPRSVRAGLLITL
ncbi:MAG TPA: TonB-dependent receptor [Myxococcales bacterium]|nr:TonB-dependent receptor [Myxococcales bacterium]